MILYIMETIDLRPFGQDYNNNLSNIAATNFLLLGQAVPDDLAPSLFAD